VLGLLAIGVLVGVAAWLIHGAAVERADARIREGYERALAVPGIVVSSIERAGDRYRIEGLRDPRAEPASAVIARAGLPSAVLALVPFDSLDERFETPSDVVDREVRALEAIEIEFATGAATLDATARDAVQRAAELVMRTRRAAIRAEASLCVEVAGHADSTGTEARNETLRSSRAAIVTAALRDAGVTPELVVARGVDRPPVARRVTLRATLRPDIHSPGCPP
jgi:outer membrane protein OmpA-like peptidoglycan-associated protein